MRSTRANRCVRSRSASRDGYELSEWLARADERPLVYLTFGTIFNVTEGAFGAAVEALRVLDVRGLDHGRSAR